MTYTPSEATKREFCEVYARQSEEDFISSCSGVTTERGVRVARAIRRTIAKLAEIDPEFIRAELSFNDLYRLPFWYRCGDAGFDTGQFIEAIESELNDRLTEKQWIQAKVRDPDLNIEMKIFEFVNEFSVWYETL